jgi:hypothetical protein
MKRRTLLATGTATLAAGTAGCSGLLGGTTTLGRPEEQLDDDGMEKHLVFRDGDDRIVVITLDQRTRQKSPTDRFRFRLYIAHGYGDEANGGPATSVDSFRFDLRTPLTSVDPPANVFLAAPEGGPWPDFTFERDDDLWTRIAVEDVGELGEGTIGLTTIVDPLDVPVEEVGVRADLTLSEDGFGARRIEPRRIRGSRR